MLFSIGVGMENEPTVVYVLFSTDSLYSRLRKVKHFGRNSIWFRRDRGKLDVLKLNFGYSETSMQSRLRIKSELVKMQEQKGTGELEWQVKKWSI